MNEEPYKRMERTGDYSEYYEWEKNRNREDTEQTTTTAYNGYTREEIMSWKKKEEPSEQSHTSYSTAPKKKGLLERYRDWKPSTKDIGRAKEALDKFNKDRQKRHEKTLSKREHDVRLREREARLHERESRLRRRSAGRAMGFLGGVGGAIENAFSSPGSSGGPVIPNPLNNDPYGHASPAGSHGKKHKKSKRRR